MKITIFTRHLINQGNPARHFYPLLFLLILTLPACYRSKSKVETTQLQKSTSTEVAALTPEPTSPIPPLSTKTVQSTPSSTLLPITPSIGIATDYLSTPTPLVYLPEIRGSSNQYSLQPPSPEILINLQLSRTSQFMYSNNAIDELLYPSFHDILDFEWRQSYTHSLFTADFINLIPSFYDHSRGRLTEQMLTDLIGDYVTQEFINNNLPLDDLSSYDKSGFQGKMYRVEIDGDSESEWLVGIKNWDGYYLGEGSFWITLDRNYDGKIRRLENQIPWQSGISTVGESKGFLGDLTGDGKDDIAILEEGPDAPTPLLQFHLAKGSKNGFESITSSINKNNGMDEDIISYMWLTSPENLLPSLQITLTRKLLPWNCEIYSVKEYQWVNGDETVKDVESAKLNHPECLIALALDKEAAKDYEGAIQLLKLANNQKKSLSEETQVFLNFRLALLYLLENNQIPAEKYLRLIEEMTKQESVPIAVALHDQIYPLLQTEKIKPFDLCLAAEAIAKTSLKNMSRPDSVNIAYPYEGFEEGYPVALCDTREIMWKILSSIPIDMQEEIPEIISKESGIPIAFSKRFSLSNAPSNWLVIIGDSNPGAFLDRSYPIDLASEQELQVYWYSPEIGWEPVTRLPAPMDFESLTWFSSDTTGDGIPEFGLALPAIQPEWANCTGNENPVTIFIITTLFETWPISLSTSYCQNQINSQDLRLLLGDKNRDGNVDIVAHYFDEELYDLSRLSEITPTIPGSIQIPGYKDLYKQTNKDFIITRLTDLLLHVNDKSSLRSEIEFYLNRWGTDDEIGRIIYDQLNYLLALSYRLDGDETKAVNLFFDIWSHQSASIWSYLASSQLRMTK